MRDYFTNAIAVFQKGSVIKVTEDLVLSEPVPLEMTRDAWQPFMHSGRIFIGHTDGTCTIYNDDGLLIEDVKSTVPPQESDRHQFF